MVRFGFVLMVFVLAYATNEAEAAILSSTVQKLVQPAANARNYVASQLDPQKVQDTGVDLDLTPSELLNILNDLLNSNAEFQEIFAQLSSEETYQLVEEIRHLDEVQRAVAVLTNFGVDVDKYLRFVYDLFGWDF